MELQHKMVKPSLIVLVAGLGAGVRGAAAQQLPPLTSSDVTHLQAHAWLMWSSMGFLFPLGAILIRYSRNQRYPDSAVSPARPRWLFYAHVMVMCLAVGNSTAGISLLLNHFGPTFHHTHMRLGLSVWIIAMMMPFIGLVRPLKNTPWRPYWYSVHWLLGTAVGVLGIVNCYIGLSVYQLLRGSVRHLVTAFTVEVAFLGLAYFLQDRVSYVLRQGPKGAQPAIKSGRHQVTETNLPSETNAPSETA